MDTSETYIKMRLAAIPDLGMGMPIECPCNYIENDVWVDVKGDWYYSTEHKSFQLERQDQLQEMVYGREFFTELPRGIRLREETDQWSIMPRFFLFCYDFKQNNTSVTYTPNDYANCFASMEQLWLAFAQKELHNKVWNGEDWVKN